MTQSVVNTDPGDAKLISGPLGGIEGQRSQTGRPIPPFGQILSL